MAKGNIFDYERVRSPDMTEQFKLVDDAFALGKPYTIATPTTLVVADLGKTIRVNSTSGSAVIVTFPAVDSDEDGGRIRVIKQGSGDLTVTPATGDAIATFATPHSDKTSSDFASAEYEYVDGITRWVAISHEGTWAST